LDTVSLPHGRGQGSSDDKAGIPIAIPGSAAGARLSSAARVLPYLVDRASIIAAHRGGHAHGAGCTDAAGWAPLYSRFLPVYLELEFEPGYTVWGCRRGDGPHSFRRRSELVPRLHGSNEPALDPAALGLGRTPAVHWYRPCYIHGAARKPLVDWQSALLDSESGDWGGSGVARGQVNAEQDAGARIMRRPGQFARGLAGHSASS